MPAKSSRLQEIEPKASQIVAAKKPSSKTIAMRSATLVEFWVDVTDVNTNGELDVFIEILPDGSTPVEELSSTGITTVGMQKLGVLSRNDKDALGLAARAQFQVKVDTVEFRIFALVRE